MNIANISEEKNCILKPRMKLLAILVNYEIWQHAYLEISNYGRIRNSRHACNVGENSGWQANPAARSRTEIGRSVR